MRKGEDYYDDDDINIHKKESCGVKAQHKDVEVLLVITLYALKKRAKIVITNALITKKATEFDEDLHGKVTGDFTSGWIWRFKGRCIRGDYGSKGKKLFK